MWVWRMLASRSYASMPGQIQLILRTGLPLPPLQPWMCPWLP